MITAVAVVLTALVVGVLATVVAVRRTRSVINQAIGGRTGLDPVDEHRRLVAESKEQALEAQRQAALLDLSLEQLTSGVIVTDVAGNVLVRNRLAGSSSPRSHERTLVDATTAELLAAAVQGERVEREIEIFGPPARILFAHAMPISENAQVVGAIAVIDDVTDHHRIDKTRRDFIANLSHELRTPVGAVSLLAEMLTDERDPATLEHLTGRLIGETDRMTATIDDLLELSRIESNTQSFDEPVIVQEVLEEAAARVRVQAEAKQISVGSHAPDEPIEILGNRDQLLSAITNLVQNAVKYSEGGDSVILRARVDNDVLELIVQDTGRGIPARDLDRVFERFYRVDRSRDATTGGTGIGLSIVRHVALNHGGSVSVDSFEGDGSTFTMALPVISAPTRLDSTPSQHELS